MSSNVFRRLLQMVLEERAEELGASSSVVRRGNHYILGDWDPLSTDARASAESGRLMRQGETL